MSVGAFIKRRYYEQMGKVGEGNITRLFALPKSRLSVKSLPNLFTLSRLLLCPAISYHCVVGNRQLGFFLFVLACVTDLIDGYAAKKFHATSNLGSLLDPIADKILSLCAFFLLMANGKCPAWFLGLLITVTLLQCLGLSVLKFPAATPKSAFAPLRVGKINTMLQFLWAGILLADICFKNIEVNPTVISLGTLLVGTYQIVVFFRYFFRFRHLLGRYLSLTPSPEL